MVSSIWRAPKGVCGSLKGINQIEHQGADVSKGECTAKGAKKRALL
jgi:hypothetical protein